MKQGPHSNLSFYASAVILGALVWMSLVLPGKPETQIPALLFGVLVIFTNTFGAPLGGGLASLMPMALVAAFLVVGLVPAGWIAFLSAFVHGAIRHRFARQLGERKEFFWRTSLNLAATNAAIQTASILFGGSIYRLAGGELPLSDLGLSSLVPLFSLGVTYLSANFLLAGFFISGQGHSALRDYLRAVSMVALYEGVPLVFAPLLALVYVHFGRGAFILSSLAVVASSLVTRTLAFARQRLERRLKELDSLHRVGNALSASLNLNAILVAIYVQVVRLMPAESFYVALYEADSDEVSFPFVIEEGERVQWPSRRGGRGLTEHILRTRSSLISRESTDVLRRQLGLSKAERPATSWLGVPILAGDELLGVIAVQSFSAFDLYDETHQEILTTIASQASVAIQNARLYARTDEALIRRVQEMDSILRTVKEGILLLDINYRVLAANRALAEFLGVARLEMLGVTLDQSRTEAGTSLLESIGYSMIGLETDCRELAAGGEDAAKQTIVLPGSPELQLERTLTPVRDPEGNINGWLLAFRDLTEEIELERLREDMLHMLIHDLRSPLAVLQGSISTLRIAMDEGGKKESIDQLLDLADRGSNRVIHLVNELLDIARMESGQINLDLERIAVDTLLENAVAQIAPVAEEAQIKVEIQIEDNLPPLYGDPEHLERVLNNLLDNAVKFTPDQGRIDLWARLGTEHTPPSILIGVSDTGPGISAEIRGRLFEKFQQGASTRGRRSGSGLGLHYCKLAVEAHGGEIWVESKQKQGSTFMIRLPLLGSRS